MKWNFVFQKHDECINEGLKWSSSTFITMIIVAERWNLLLNDVKVKLKHSYHTLVSTWCNLNFISQNSQIKNFLPLLIFSAISFYRTSKRIGGDEMMFFPLSHFLTWVREFDSDVNWIKSSFFFSKAKKTSNHFWELC